MGNLCVFPVLGWKCSWEICACVFCLSMKVLTGNLCVFPVLGWKCSREIHVRVCCLRMEVLTATLSVHVFALNTSDPDS